MRKLLSAVIIVMAGLWLSPNADATPLLTFGQLTGGSPITAVNSAGNTVTTITGTTVPVLVTSFLGGGAPFGTILDLSLTSTTAITTTVIAGQNVLAQEYSGTATFASGGTTYLKAVFSDALFAIQGASSLTISASQPPGSIVFTSDVLSPAYFNDPLAISFSFANVVPPANIAGTTLQGFTSTISGTSSTNFVPEPFTLAVLGSGLAGLGFARRGRRS